MKALIIGCGEPVEEVVRVEANGDTYYRGALVTFPLELAVRLRFVMQNLGRPKGAPAYEPVNPPGIHELTWGGETVIRLEPGGVQLVRGEPASDVQVLSALGEWTDRCFQLLTNRC